MALTHGRKAVFIWLTILLVVVALEALSAILLSLLDGRLFSYSRLQSERDLVSGDRHSTQPDDARQEAAAQWSIDVQERHVLHPYLGFVQDPDGDPAARRWSLNRQAASFGFPRNLHPLFNQATPDRLTVAVVGGSVARQVSYGGRDLLEKRLAEIERFRGREIFVLGLAIGGYKEPQQLMTVNYFLALGMDIDVVINIDGFNEVVLPTTENTPLGVHPAYPRGWSHRVGSLDSRAQLLQGEVSVLNRLRQGIAERFSRVPWRHSSTSSLGWRLLDTWLVRTARTREAEILEQGPADRSYQAVGPPYSVTGEDELLRDLAAIWERSSLQIYQLTQARGIEYYHFLQPNQYFEGSKTLTAQERRKAWDPGSGCREPVSKGYPLLRERGAALHRAGVEFHDLSMTFEDVGEPIYIDVCCHYNELGIALVVGRIVEAIASSTQSSRPLSPVGSR